MPLNSPPEKSCIYLSVSSDDKEIEFKIRNPGKGIPLEEQELIWQPFYQVKEEDTKGGTGLGLFIAKRLVEAHGGKVGVNSQEGRGCCFYFSLPLKAKDECSYSR